MQIKATIQATALALTALASQAATPLQASNPLVSQQWYLQNTGQNAFSKRGGLPGIDLNLAATHTAGIRGEGVTIAIIDDGLEIRHPDLSPNIAAGSRNFLDSSDDPTPKSGRYAHGTAVAGIAAAAEAGPISVRGVAPAARLQGFNFLQPGVQNTVNWLHAHGKLLNNQPSAARVFNQSYGSSPLKSQPGNPISDTNSFIREDTYEEMSTSSHNGKGVVFVKSAGNEFEDITIDNKGSYIVGHEGNSGLPMQDANLTFDNSNYWNIVVSALNADGVRSSYSSVGANVLLTAPGGEYGLDSPAMVTTDLMGCARGNNTSKLAVENKLHGGSAIDPNCNYSGIMNGTSAAAPAVSGAIALVMSAKPELSARDIRNILIKTARQVDADNKGVTLSFAGKSGAMQSFRAIPGWQKNAAGLSFHPFYGFGLVDVDRAVAMARIYDKPLPSLQKTQWQTVPVAKPIPDAEQNGVESHYVNQNDLTVEAVQVLVDAKHGRANDLAVELISPSGTRSVLLTPRTALVNETYGLNQQRLLSNQFYGERAKGRWTLRVVDTNSGEYKYVYHDGSTRSTTVRSLPKPQESGLLQSWSIRFIGHNGSDA
ncbi:MULTISPECIES: S8 family serine peptidase [Chromobacterium]|uniref:S8 family serine peptidase n=1 Tax=Chromobacterium TaxID=535 RepID=UPI001887B49D|nr:MULTISPECIES: S8 family serine peptidase [Chromobacterium]QOZ83754.1 peptidase S8 [Chromobacterium sp. Rain0013]WON83889.1 S8 family serine peptidase [Chromobacterium haemolyticum]